jgi:hypothetical protein
MAEIRPLAHRNSATQLSRRGVLGWLIASLFVRPQRTSAQDLQQPDWDEIRRIAEEVLAHESAPNSFPFERPGRLALVNSPRKVFFHYFPPFPLSFKNQPRGRDHYDDQYLRREGEDNRYANLGGYLRERPMAVGPWQTRFWQQINYAIEILRARLTGADGYMVDVLRLRSDPSWERIRILFDTTAAIDRDFHLALEPDAAALRDINPEVLVETLLDVASSPSAFRLNDGRLLVAPFNPENYPASFWQTVIDEMARHGTPIAFLPVLLNPLRHAAAFAPFSYGLSYWGSKDVNSVKRGNEDGIRYHLGNFSPVFMQPITPQDARPKSAAFSESNNTVLFRELWMKAIENNVPYVQVITWNDYSESTEVSPSSGTQFLFYDLATYFITWFKTGRQPTIIRDAIYYSHRRQLVAPGMIVRAGDTPMQLRGATPVHNQIELLALLTRPATLQIEIAGKRFERNAQAGLVTLQAPATLGRPIFRIFRHDHVEVEKISDWEIGDPTDAADPLYVGGSSTRKFCANSQC